MCCFDGLYKTYVSGIFIYISFDLYNADSNKENSLFQRLRDTEKYKKTESRFHRALIITFVWVVNMLFLIRLPKLLEDASEKEKQVKIQYLMRRHTFETNIPTGK